ncbi:hypothetical protein CH371_17895 [Leptospira wolffii]|uniref:Uncharacterized protein n=1 Tax=Leptospira wolffii TaxID=409998 RepID=A0A2M9Z898_9LEPT|nr:hypothetical protein [Leptospira wolffii]PJZ64640.1 hypothetical protein CH371_17895 [Leptospira wolffii]
MKNYFLDNSAIQFLNEKLKLPSTGREQDWEFELSNASRIHEFLVFYIKNSLTKEQKRALVALLLSTYEDYLQENADIDSSIWKDLELILRSEPEIFREIIDYWSVWGEVEEDNFFILTKRIRNIEYK